jgi:zinc protease
MCFRHLGITALRPTRGSLPPLPLASLEIAALPHVAIDRHQLANGLRVILSHDDRAPIVAVNLWYDVGSRHEKPGKTGFAHLFEHMMFQGSANVAKGEHFDLVQGAGGTLNATTWLDRTNYFETLPSHELELGLWLEADRLAGLLPAMTQEKLDNQRDVVKNERRWSVDNQPYGTWDEKLQALLFPDGHPYHHPTIGSMDDLDAASLDDVREFFAAHYAPNNAVLTIAGDFDSESALKMVEKHFGPITANPAIPAAPSTAVDSIIGAEVRMDVPDRVPLPRIYAAYRMPTFGTDGFDALGVAVDLLGSGRASRLYRALVREQQVAQDVTTFAFPVIGGAAIFTIWVTARPGVAHEALEAVLWAEVDRLTAEGPSDDELERARNLHAAGVESSLERISERADRLSMYACLFDQPERINTEVSRYEAVDAGRVREAMKASLRPDNRVVLTYLPAESAEPVESDHEGAA